MLRVYWYDGPGSFANGSFVKAAEHAIIDDLDDFKLRMGTRNHEGAQKGVDGLVIADLINLSQNRAISEALLMSGDADLAPGVVAAQQLGLRVHLLTLGKGAASPYLKAEMDRKQHWPDEVVLAFARPVQGCVASQPADSSVVSAGEAASAPGTAESTEDVILRSARICFENLTVEQRLLIVPGSPIPPEVDRLLLRQGRQIVRARLEEEEKRFLRRELQNIAARARAC